VRVAELTAMAILGCAILIVPSMAGGGSAMAPAVAAAQSQTSLDRRAATEVERQRARPVRS
jgi:hypothetical protein